MSYRTETEALPDQDMQLIAVKVAEAITLLTAVKTFLKDAKHLGKEQQGLVCSAAEGANRPECEGETFVVFFPDGIWELTSPSFEVLARSV